MGARRRKLNKKLAAGEPLDEGEGDDIEGASMSTASGLEKAVAKGKRKRKAKADAEPGPATSLAARALAFVLIVGIAALYVALRLRSGAWDDKIAQITQKQPPSEAPGAPTQEELDQL